VQLRQIKFPLSRGLVCPPGKLISLGQLRHTKTDPYEARDPTSTARVSHCRLDLTHEMAHLSAELQEKLDELQQELEVCTYPTALQWPPHDCRSRSWKFIIQRPSEAMVIDRMTGVAGTRRQSG
jgi:hypothetical protein